MEDQDKTEVPCCLSRNNCNSIACNCPTTKLNQSPDGNDLLVCKCSIDEVYLKLCLSMPSLYDLLRVWLDALTPLTRLLLLQVLCLPLHLLLLGWCLISS